MCRAAQEAGVPPVSILTERKKTHFSHLCSSVIPYPIGTKFAREVPASKGSLHTKYEENRSSHFRDTSEQNFVLISSFFFLLILSTSSSFRILRKIRHKTRMRARIGLKFGTLKGLIKADLCTNFGRNPMNIHGVMTDYFPQVELHLLRSCLGVCKLNHFLRTISPNCVISQLERFDYNLRSALGRICKSSISDLSWLQATLPRSMGGLGLREATSTSSAAFLGSCFSSQELCYCLLQSFSGVLTCFLPSRIRMLLPQFCCP